MNFCLDPHGLRYVFDCRQGDFYCVLATVCAHIKNNYIQSVTETKNNEACVFQLPQQAVFKFEMQAVHIIKNLCLVLIQSQSPLTSYSTISLGSSAKSLMLIYDI